MSGGECVLDQYTDELGPEKIVYVHDARSGLRGIVVIDNVACGPAIGGVRMALDVTTEEVFRLARAMTLKNAAAGLPHGGGKAGILAANRTPDKEDLIRAFGRAIRELTDYIPGPDMGTDETCMGWLFDETRRVVGLPRALGGIPLDEIGATGYGLAQCAEVAAPFCGLKLDGATLAVEGFGNVGKHAARFLEEAGVKLVAASDTGGAVHDPRGIPVAALIAAKSAEGSVTGYEQGQPLKASEIFSIPHDILIPAARPDSIHSGNVDSVQAKLILQGANIPATAAAEAALHAAGVLVVPDFIANAGGVICGAFEYHGGAEANVFDEIAGRIRRNTEAVLARCSEEGVEPRRAAIDLARERVEEAMKFRRAR